MFAVSSMTVSTTGRVRSGGTRGLFSRSLKCNARSVLFFFFFFWVKHNVEYCPQNLWAFLFLSASLKARVFGLNTASGAPFEELLLCVEMTTGMSGRCCTCG